MDMKFKNAVHRSVIIITILVLSFLIGYVYQAIGHKMDLKSHPREYSEYVTKYAAEYGVPEYIVYSVILEGSDFQSNYVSDDGRIGLMQISPESFRWLLSITKEDLDTGILYDPDTNIRYGTYMLSHLYTQYNRWKTVLAIYKAGENTVGMWMQSSSNVDSNGNLTKIPDKSVEAFVSAVEKQMEIYRELYYENN
ncbi:MAG: lytic transglycosylase domain-containing protein [Ruminococcaceae bacterium]|nr:lytic transglycosylase domain-containing protein [Oscillospiraceae bacterium]